MVNEIHMKAKSRAALNMGI
jgi:hypothetical protein